MDGTGPPPRVVFDLDGTLIDSAPDIQGVANDLLAREGAAPITLIETRGFIGNGVGVFVAKMRDARGIGEDRQAALADAFLRRYETAVTRTLPYPGVEAALETLADHGALGICTNKALRPCRAVLRHLRLDRFFGTVWGGDSLPTRKPDPAMLHAAFDALPGGARIYVGDSEVDAETAVRARVPFLLFTGGYRKSPPAEIAHTATFDHFDDLPALVRAVAKG